MFTVKASWGILGARVTDVMECSAARVTYQNNGAACVWLMGGKHDGQGFTTKEYEGRSKDFTVVSEIIIENSNGKTTEIFRD